MNEIFIFFFYRFRRWFFLLIVSKDENVGTMDRADVICLDSDERKPQREVSFHTSEVDPLHCMHISSEVEEDLPVTSKSMDNNFDSDECEEDNSIECVNHGLGDELHVSQTDLSSIENSPNIQMPS